MHSASRSLIAWFAALTATDGTQGVLPIVIVGALVALLVQIWAKHGWIWFYSRLLPGPRGKVYYFKMAVPVEYQGVDGLKTQPALVVVTSEEFVISGFKLWRDSPFRGSRLRIPITAVKDVSRAGTASVCVVVTARDKFDSRPSKWQLRPDESQELLQAFRKATDGRLAQQSDTQ